MSRLNFAPGPREIRLSSAGKGEFVFTPKLGEPISFEALQTAVDRAGYALYSAEVVVEGTLALDGQRWLLVADPAGQRFTLGGKNMRRVLADATPGTRVEVTGGWKAAVVKGAGADEVVSVRAVRGLKGPAKE